MITTEELARIRTAAVGDMLGDSKALDEIGPSAVIFRLCQEIKRLEHEADWLAGRASIKDCVMYDTVENCIKKGFPCIKCFREKARKVVGGRDMNEKQQHGLMPEKLTPGSKKACAAGCLCPIIDNHYGAGFYTSSEGPLFVINENCPLHGRNTEESCPKN